MKELAEVLAVDFDTEGIAKLRPDWRWEDEEQALLTSCSSLITTVGPDYSRVVQFSHFSVKEYLTSDRLATSSGDVSRYHIDLEPAHTILAQVCMGALLQPRDGVENNGVKKWFALAGYAAGYWVKHAQFERVSSFLRQEMECLFDLDYPYFGAWVKSYDIDTHEKWKRSSLYFFTMPIKFRATPLCYAALCGFEDLVEHLVVKYPEQLHTSGGYYATPLIAALAGRQFRTVAFLQRKGAHVDVRGVYGRTPLDSAAYYGDLEMVRVLLDHKADVNVRDDLGWTPLHFVSSSSCHPNAHSNIPQLWFEVARLLIEHGADVNARSDDGGVPLHLAETVGFVHWLLEHGANMGAVDNEGGTPWHSAARYGRVEVVRMLLELGADVDAVDNKGRTPLHLASATEVVRVLLELGANVGAVDTKGRTPLHSAVDNWDEVKFYGPAGEFMRHRRLETVRVLLAHGVNVDAEDNEGRTPFQIASVSKDGEIIKLLLEHGAEGML